MIALKQTAQRFMTSVTLIMVSACTTTQIAPPPVIDLEVSRPSIPAVSIPVPSAAVISELPNQDRVNLDAVPRSPSTLVTGKQNPAVIALLGTADAAQQEGDFESAQTALQRAQRIAPQDPDVYYRLAVTHRSLEDYRLAEQVALKGVSIVQGQSNQLRRFWLLIADIRMQSGDISAAEKADAMANRY